MEKINKLIALILIQSLLLAGSCSAGNVFTDRTETAVSMLSPKLSIGVYELINAMYLSRAAHQDKDLESADARDDNLAEALLSAQQFKKFKAIKQYYEEGVFERLSAEADKVNNILRSAPMLRECYGIGFPFYGNVNIHKRMRQTLNRLKNKEISAEVFLQMITPDLDSLIVVDDTDKGPWEIRENMDEGLKNHLVDYVARFRRQFAAINARVQSRTIVGDLYADRDYAIETLMDEGKLLLDIVFVPSHIWNEMPVFVMPEDMKYFKFIRDILFSLNSGSENKSEVPEEFMHNYVLNQIQSRGNVRRESLLVSFLKTHVYSELIELYSPTREMVSGKFIGAVELAKTRGLIQEQDGILALGSRGREYLSKILERRERLLINGYAPDSRESFVALYHGWLQKLKASDAREQDLADADIIRGTRNSLHVRQKSFKEMIEGIEDGSEIHFAAPGGGGDTLGTIFLIKILQQMFVLQGKKNIKFKAIFPSIKYGKENPFAGDIKIGHVKGVTPIAIEGQAQPYFYTISKELKARIPIEDKNGNQLFLKGEPVFYESLWSEGRIVDLAQKDGIELIMMDMSQKAGDLKSQYQAMKKGKKVVTFYGDMGGDSLAQIPGKINDNNHAETTIASPVSDLTGLVIFDGPAWILALGGDGESLEKTQRALLTNLFERGQIAALFDMEDYLRQRYGDENDPIDILSDMDEYARRFRSEVSKNLFWRHKQISLDQDMKSVVKAQGPWNYPAMLRTDDRIEPTTLRYEKREEYLSKYYLSALVVDSTQSMRENIKTKEVLREDLTWAQRQKVLRDLNYATEGLSYVVYRSKIKNFADMFFTMIVEGRATEGELIDIFFNGDFSVELQLAAAQALYRRFHFINGGEKITRRIGSRLIEMMSSKEHNVFLVAEIAKTVGIVGYEDGIDVLHDFLNNPKNYGQWPFFNLYFYPYAKRRILDTAERSIRRLIEKVLSRDGAQKAWNIFKDINGTHPLFKELEDKIKINLNESGVYALSSYGRIERESMAFQLLGQGI